MKQPFDISKKKKFTVFGFTLVEVAAVTAIVSSLPSSSYSGVKKQAEQIKCQSQLRSIGQQIAMNSMMGGNPKASFYPKNSNARDSIKKQLGGASKLWICPTMPDKLKKTGLTYIYNSNLSGKESRNPSKDWILIEMTAVSKKAPFPHPKGFNILYADGHVESSKKLPADILKVRK
ncbi:MAG: hypothetical protein MK193_12225 [Lentisphaeria bacterium]|nr:hypothetical protein [Lentisphaeria bacterium]